MPASHFALNYQLEQDLQPSNREEVLKLEQRRMGLCVIWVPVEVGGGYEYIYAGMSRTCLRQRLSQHLSRSERNVQLRIEIELFQAAVMFSVDQRGNPATGEGHHRRLEAVHEPPRCRGAMTVTCLTKGTTCIPH